MEQPKVGQLIEPGEKRDAIHIAIAPVVATEKLYPGDRVGFAVKGDQERVCESTEPVGIIDPYLTKPVRAGDCCWLFLFPQTVTSLRHEWEHPAFTKQLLSGGPEASRQWVTEFAESFGQTYDSLMSAAGRYHTHGDWAYDNSERYKEVSAKQWATFWSHYAAITGEDVGNEDEAPFTCSC